MQRWEYVVYKTADNPLVGMQETLAKSGHEGWEMVGAVADENHGVILFFKRPKR